MAYSKFLLNAAAAIIASLAVIGALALLVLGSAAAIRVVVPDPQAVKATALSGPVVWAHGLERHAGVDEKQAARKAGLTIREWAVNCRLAIVDEELDVARPTNSSDNPIFDHIKPLMNALYDARVLLADDIGNSFNILKWATIASILIGLGTTIFAGLRSLEDKVLNAGATAVKILAVVFPAVGTAVAALAAFYAPRDDLLRISQSLAPLQQLNAEVQVWLSRAQCPVDADGRTKILQKLEGWEDRLILLLPATTAVRIGTRAKDSSSGGGWPASK